MGEMLERKAAWIKKGKDRKFLQIRAEM